MKGGTARGATQRLCCEYEGQQVRKCPLLRSSPCAPGAAAPRAPPCSTPARCTLLASARTPLLPCFTAPWPTLRSSSACAALWLESSEDWGTLRSSTKMTHLGRPGGVKESASEWSEAGRQARSRSACASAGHTLLFLKRRDVHGAAALCDAHVRRLCLSPPSPTTTPHSPL